MKSLKICKLNPNKYFKTQDEARNWLLENIGKLETLIRTGIKEPEYLDDVPEFVRPDIYGEINNSGKLLVVSINLNNEITNDDLGKFIDIVAHNDASIAIWILADLDVNKQIILDWISQKTEPDLELVILKLTIFQIENSEPVPSLDRM